MKNIILSRFFLLMLMFSSLSVGQLWAQLTELEVGKVYHFANVNYTTKAMGAASHKSVGGVISDNTNKAQLWYVETSQVKDGVSYYALRNLGYGGYLQGNGQSAAWTLADNTDADKSWFALTAANGNTAIRSYNERSNNYGYAHIDGSSNIVGWESGASSTQWTVTKKDMSDSDIQAALGIFSNVETYQTALDALFSDKACTTLNGSLDENNESFKALPTTLQDMMRKVAGTTSWEEANKDNTKESWGADYAKKYRVQLYEPYNDAGAAASALGLNAHTNMNNPTGIFANNGDVLYVMVESEIQEGASLYLAYYKGHDKVGTGSTEGYELKQGLNVIPVFYDESNFCVNYVVQTFDTSDGKKGNKAKARQLSEYAPIKIHIEGGYINGYWNKLGDELYTADTNDSWEYIKARATQKTVTVLGKYMTLQFPLLDEHTVDTDGNTNKGLATYFNDLVKIEDCINEWDNVMLWERLLLGVLGESTIKAEAKKSPYSDKETVFEYTGNDGEFESDYSDYYNIHGLSFGIPNSYMYGGWDHCGYNFNTMGGVIQTLPTNAGSHWGPGHEIGHQHQGLLTVNGLTEVTNNLFSNVVLWMYGETTSRYNGTEGALSNVLAQYNAEGTDFFSNNIWAQTIMYYKLFLYYHVLGHNPKFYPRLFEMLRQDPMSTGYEQDGSKCLMHFYKKCCLAAGEDLTEFFRAHGFFKVMNNRLVGDYSNSVYNLTQEQIDAAIKEVKDLGYNENISVLFITDATGETIKSHKGDNLDLYGETTVCAEMGSYANFNNNTEANYTYNISGTTVTMEGTGGVGLAILNDKGELIGFSDKKTFEISPEAAEAIVSGHASIVTLQADNTPVTATNIMDSGDDDTRHQLLGNLLNDAKAALDCSDDSGKKVGFYRASALEDLQKAYDTAKGVYDAMTASAYSAVYDVLFQEYANLINNEYARINITEGVAYRLTNKAYPTRNMGVFTEEGDDKNEMFGLTADESSDAQIWYLEPSTTAGSYYLKNKATSLYPGGASSGSVLSADKEASTKGEKSGAAAYRLDELETGVFALINGPALHCSSSQSNNIVGWNAEGDASRWYITAVEVDNALEARMKLEETMDNTTALINEMADAVAIQKFKLQNDNPEAAFYISTNACYNTLSGKTDGQGLSGLLDEETSTFFHSDYSGKATGTHYLQVDLGASHNVGQFKFNYTTRDNGNNCPTAILVEGSADGETFNQLATYTAANDALPNGNALSWESPVISNSNNYRYLRFSVTATENSKAFFVMSTFGITNPTPVVNAIKDDFVGDDASNEALKTQIVNALTELAEAQQLVDGASATENAYNQQNADLNAYYTALLEVYNTAKNADFNAKKQELLTLIGQANTLITECGSVNYTPATEAGITLHYDAATNYPYLSCSNLYGANGASNGGDSDINCEHLLDGKSDTWIHTDYNAAASTYPHYLQVDFGTTDAAPEHFKFTYATRHNGANQVPKEIQVKGSNDGENYDALLATYSFEDAINPLPTTQNTTWTAEKSIQGGYRYLRFYVTMSPQTNPYFAMSMFGMTEVTIENYVVTINPNMGDVDETAMLTTYKEVVEAQSTYNLATTEQQVVKAIAQLQAQYDVLLEAKNNQYVQDLQAKIDETEALIAECGRVENGEVVEVFEAAGDATKQQLLDAYNQVVVANALITAAGATQSQYEEATSALEEKRAALATAKAGTVKSTLRALTGDVATLITLCGTTPGDVSEVMLNALTTANQEALDLLQGDNLTAIAEKTTALQAQYTTVATAQQATGKSTLSSLIADMTTLISECTTGEGETLAYVGDVTETLLNNCIQAKDAAQAVIDANNTTTADFTAATETLQGHYNTLLAAKNSTAKADLREMIAQLDELINKCRISVTNTVTDEVKCELQTTSETGDFYLSTNAGTKEGGIANLVDNDTETYFHSAESGAGEQYLLVDAGDGNTLKKFNFSYQTNNSPFPYTIKVYGSNDKSDFVELATFDNLPTSTELWTSSDISSGTAYRYLRFNVTKSVIVMHVDDNKEVDTSNGQLSNKFKSTTFSETPASEYCFVMSEFNLTKIVDEEQEAEILAGTVTEDQLTAANEAITDAETLANTSAVKTELEAQTATLQNLYDALNDAYGIQVSLATTYADRDELLIDIEYGKTIGTFSARYATVIPEGVTAYYAEAYNGGEGSVVSLIPVEEGKALPANQGVILIGAEGYNNVTFVPATDENVANLSSNILANSASGPVIMGNNDYILAIDDDGIGLYQAEQGTELKQGKAYFNLSSASSNSLVLNFGGSATDINAVTTGTPSDDELIYDIYGRRVTEVKKGNIYIKNGKKFIVK